MKLFKEILMFIIGMILVIIVIPFILITSISKSIIEIINCIGGEIEWRLFNYKEDEHTHYAVSKLSDLPGRLRKIWF